MVSVKNVRSARDKDGKRRRRLLRKMQHSAIGSHVAMGNSNNHTNNNSSNIGTAGSALHPEQDLVDNYHYDDNDDDEDDDDDVDDSNENEMVGNLVSASNPSSVNAATLSSSALLGGVGGSVHDFRLLVDHIKQDYNKIRAEFKEQLHGRERELGDACSQQTILNDLLE